MTIAQDLGRFVAGLDITTMPDDVQEKARACLLWDYGIALAGRMVPPARTARAAVMAMDGANPQGATLLLDGSRSSPIGAAFANAVLISARAQSDTCGTMHVGGPTIPVLTALLETGGYPIERLIPALVAAFEISGLLDINFGRTSSLNGFRGTQLYGSIGVAAAAARLMGLDAERTAAALSNAACFTGGLLEPFAAGTEEWRFQYGMAARNGLLAAELARAGSLSAPEAFEGKSGLFKAFVRTDVDAATLLAPLGQEWSMRRALFKPYPVCSSNQTPVITALALREKLAGRGIEKIRVRMNPFRINYPGQAEWGPFDNVTGTIMSVPFGVALALAHGSPSIRGLSTFDDPTVNRLTAKVELIPDEAISTPLCSRIEVDAADGTTIVHEERRTPQDFAFGRDEASRLVRAAGGEIGISPAAYDRLDAFVDGLPQGSIGEVVQAFAHDPLERLRA